MTPIKLALCLFALVAPMAMAADPDAPMTGPVEMLNGISSVSESSVSRTISLASIPYITASTNQAVSSNSAVDSDGVANIPTWKVSLVHSPLAKELPHATHVVFEVSKPASQVGKTSKSDADLKPTHLENYRETNENRRKSKCSSRSYSQQSRYVKNGNNKYAENLIQLIGDPEGTSLAETASQASQSSASSMAAPSNSGRQASQSSASSMEAPSYSA